MKRNKEGMRWIVAICLSGSALLFFLRMLIIWRDVDPSTGLFRPGAGLLCSIFNGVGVFLFIASLLADSKKSLPYRWIVSSSPPICEVYSI